jgi:hypothetical protein
MSTNILSSLTQLAVGGVATDLINSQPLGKTAALRAIAMNAGKCTVIPLLFPDPLDLNLWNVTFSIAEPNSDSETWEDKEGNEQDFGNKSDCSESSENTINLYLPNFNQTGLLVDVVSINFQTIMGNAGYGEIPPSINVAPLVNRKYWAQTTKQALQNASPLFNTYSFTPSDYDSITGYANIPKLSIITVAFKGSTAN